MYSIKHCKWQSHRYAVIPGIILYLSSNLSYHCLSFIWDRSIHLLFLSLFFHPFFTPHRLFLAQASKLMWCCRIATLTAGDRCRWQDRPPIQSVKDTDMKWNVYFSNIKRKTILKLYDFKNGQYTVKNFGSFHVHAGVYFFKYSLKLYPKVLWGQ